MIAWFQSLYIFIVYIFFKKRYSIKIAKTAEEKEQIFKFRHRIYRIELSNFFLDDQESKNEMVSDEYDMDDNSIILYSGELSNITGTIRLSVWKKTNLPIQVKNKYDLNESLLRPFDTVGELRFFQVRKDKRKSLLGAMLLCYLYQIEATRPELTSDIIFCDCQPGLLPLYSKLGCFSYTKKMIYQQYGILQVPLAIATFDISYLKKTHAVTYHTAKFFFGVYKNKVGRAFAKTRAQDFRALFPHLTLYQTKDEIQQYRQNLLTKPSQLFYETLIKILPFYLVVPLETGTIVIKNHIVDYDMFFILSGQLGVYIEGQCIAQLGPGRLIGEMAFFDPGHKRYADVKALLPSEILLVPRHLLETLIKNNPKAAIGFLVALCNDLLAKLVATNKMKAEGQ